MVSKYGEWSVFATRVCEAGLFKRSRGSVQTEGQVCPFVFFPETLICSFFPTNVLKLIEIPKEIWWKETRDGIRKKHKWNPESSVMGD